MIELKLSGDIAEYIDTEELKSQAEQDIKWAIQKQVSKLIKDDKEFQEAIYTELTKQIIELHMDDQITNILKNKIKSAAEGLEDWAVKHYSGMEDKLKEIFEADPEYTKILNDMISKAISEYKVDNYTISSFVTELLTNDAEYQDKLKELVGVKTEALFNGLEYD